MDLRGTIYQAGVIFKKAKVAVTHVEGLIGREEK